MSEGTKMMLTFFLTVLTFVVGQLIQRLVIEPMQEQRRVIGRIAHALTFYRGIAKDAKGEKPSTEQIEAARSVLRGSAADLRATLTVLPLYRVFAAVGLARDRETVEHVARELMRWELFMSERAATASVAKVAELLKLHYIEDEWTEFQKIMG